MIGEREFSTSQQNAIHTKNVGKSQNSTPNAFSQHAIPRNSRNSQEYLTAQIGKLDLEQCRQMGCAKLEDVEVGSADKWQWICNWGALPCATEGGSWQPRRWTQVCCAELKVGLVAGKSLDTDVDLPLLLRLRDLFHTHRETPQLPTHLHFDRPWFEDCCRAIFEPLKVCGVSSSIPPAPGLLSSPQLPTRRHFPAPSVDASIFGVHARPHSSPRWTVVAASTQPLHIRLALSHKTATTTALFLPIPHSTSDRLPLSMLSGLSYGRSISIARPLPPALCHVDRQESSSFE